MATFFVAKDGSDSNGGTSYADAFLTIGAAVTAASTGTDTIQIGPGTYNESVVTTGAGQIFTFQGDGYVTLDGGNLLVTGFNLGGTGVAANVFTINDIIVKGFTNGIGGTTTPTNGLLLTARRCRIQNSANGVAHTAAVNRTYLIANCLIHDCINGFQFTTSTASTGGQTFVGNTISDCSVGINKTGTTGLSFRVMRNILAFNTKHYNLTNILGGISLNFNDVYFDGTATSTWSATTTTSFATWKSTSGEDIDSISVDPVFLDREHKAYIPHTSSTIFDLLELIGYAPVTAIGMSENDPDGNFAGKILSNTATNTASDLVLFGASSGTARTPVIDIGGIRTIRRINIVTSLNDVDYPSNVPDFSTSDTLPKRMTFRWRGSITAFVNADVTPIFTEIEPSVLGEDVTSTVRYVQVEVTLRSDGT